MLRRRAGTTSARSKRAWSGIEQSERCIRVMTAGGTGPRDPAEQKSSAEEQNCWRER